MTEIFFVLTIIYAAYVIFTTMTDKKKVHVIDDSAEALMLRTAQPDLPPLIPEKSTAQPLVKPVTKVAKIVAIKTGLKNPETGEITKSYANYRFIKRWIKEALVTENLLEKVYKNQELTPEIEAKIKGAIANLEVIERYQA